MSVVVVFFLNQGAGAVTVVTPPADDDGDITVTAYSDCDGATIRPGRTTVLHAFDSLRNADLTGPDRTKMHRYRIVSDRTGRLPTSGLRPRIFAFDTRSGDSFAPREIILDVQERTKAQRIPAADTTDRADCDGATLRVPEWYVFQVSESKRNADLRRTGSDRDRFWVKLDVSREKSEGSTQRVFIATTGRAGDAGCPWEVVLNFDERPGGSRARDREH